jgi:hypothetical protein
MAITTIETLAIRCETLQKQNAEKDAALLSLKAIVNVLELRDSNAKAAALMLEDQQREIARLQQLVDSLTDHNARLASSRDLEERHAAFWRAEAMQAKAAIT